MNSWAAVCGSLFIVHLFIVCIMFCDTTASVSLLRSLASSWFCSCTANCDGVCCCSSTHVQISNQCFASTLCFVLFWMFVLSSTLSIWLVCLPFQWLWRQHWFTFALTNHAPSKSIPLTFTPHNHDWLLRWRLPAVLRFHFLLAAIVAPSLAPCPVPIGDCLPVRCLWLTVLWGTV